jgi:hypothetical protein
MVAQESKRIPVHEQKLAACSEKLRSALKLASRPNIRGGRILKFRDTSPETFDLFVDWLYGDFRLINATDDKSPVLRFEQACDGITTTSQSPKMVNFTSHLIQLYEFAREYKIRFLGNEVIHLYFKWVHVQRCCCATHRHCLHHELTPLIDRLPCSSGLFRLLVDSTCVFATPDTWKRQRQIMDSRDDKSVSGPFLLACLERHVALEDAADQQQHGYQSCVLGVG